MASSFPEQRLESVSLRWSDLAARRLAYFIELYESGRWRHYYDEDEFLARIKDVRAAAEAWKQLAPKRPQRSDDAVAA